MQKWKGAIDSTVISLYPNVSDIFGTTESFLSSVAARQLHRSYFK